MADEQPIIIDIPATQHQTIAHTPIKLSAIQQYKEELIKAIALPTNLIDSGYSMLAHITLPALIASLWDVFPVAIRIFWIFAVVILISICSIAWQFPECRIFVACRFLLILFGLVLGV
ncbi:hypothetical protein [Calothrix sp. 336/3]|uniref:hypothetical protein n=1 Tax=Calothrix sp. 336/3 TaxID=1337936 RepID=UPI0004E45D1C|nr:hypothetical protein [Calothrix sp. 336/3]AKG24950.1 hypothetical protein IJ00_26795 [Calothrix sp. 336/3]